MVVAIEFVDRHSPDRNYWLHLSHTAVELCREDTGAPVGIWLRATTEVVTRWWLGEITWANFDTTSEP